MELTTDEAGHCSSACIRADLGAQLGPLFCTSLASGDHLSAGNSPYSRRLEGFLERGSDLELTPWR